MDHKLIKGNSSNRQIRLAIVVSEFNEAITGRLLQGAMGRIESLQLTQQPVVVHVAGAVEIPLAAQALARRNAFDAIICLGAVVRGETTHYDYVCAQASEGCQRVMLDQNIPVIFGVLTVENDGQGLARAGGAHGNKGADAVDVALSMVSILDQISQLPSGNNK